MENLPIEMNDPKAAKYKVFPTISLGLGIFSLLINLIGGTAIIGLILGGIAAKTVEKKGLTIIGIILCIIGMFSGSKWSVSYIEKQKYSSQHLENIYKRTLKNRP